MNYINNALWQIFRYLIVTYPMFCCAESSNQKEEKPIEEDLKSAKYTNEEVFDTSKKDTIYHPDFVSIKSVSADILLDIKYATTDNFLKEAVYDCSECFLRKETAHALAKANEEFKKKGYRIKVFDCYRPLSVQKKMWKIMPGTNYVANPAKGSKHNRGAAVDLTLVDMQGNEIDMGTPYDFFGQKAHHTYQNLPQNVLENRKLLKTILDQYNFRSIYSEWWHYEYRPQRHAPIEDFVWECD